MFTQFQSNKRSAFGMDSSPIVLKRQRVQAYDGVPMSEVSGKAVKHPTSMASQSSAPSSYFSPMSYSCSSFGFGTGSVPPQSQAHHSSQVGNHAHEIKSSPPSPSAHAKEDQLPWWLQRPRRANLSAPGPSSCYYCKSPALSYTSCERCDHHLCETCTRFCDTCSAAWCPCCTVVDYDSPFDPTLCFDCFEDCRSANKSSTHTHGTRRSDRESNGSLDSDGDDVMQNW